MRKAARAVLLTPEHEVLLMRMDFPWTPSEIWILPGGRIEDGETATEAVAREVDEETGATNVTVVAEVWRREFLIESLRMRAMERYFLVPVDRFEPAPTSRIGAEEAWLREFRWWSIDALSQEGLAVAPPTIGQALRSLIELGVPETPLLLV